jgi:hypothetical protein
VAAEKLPLRGWGPDSKETIDRAALVHALHVAVIPIGVAGADALGGRRRRRLEVATEPSRWRAKRATASGKSGPAAVVSPTSLRPEPSQNAQPLGFRNRRLGTALAVDRAATAERDYPGLLALSHARAAVLHDRAALRHASTAKLHDRCAAAAKSAQRRALETQLADQERAIAARERAAADEERRRAERASRLAGRSSLSIRR